VEESLSEKHIESNRTQSHISNSYIIFYNDLHFFRVDESQMGGLSSLMGDARDTMKRRFGLGPPPQDISHIDQDHDYLSSGANNNENMRCAIMACDHSHEGRDHAPEELDHSHGVQVKIEPTEDPEDVDAESSCSSATDLESSLPMQTEQPSGPTSGNTNAKDTR